MNWRSVQAAERRQEREAQKHFRELMRRAKEEAKLSAIEQAKLEVETHESRIEVLISAHKEQGEYVDWLALKTSLPPPSPIKNAHCLYRAKQRIAVLPSIQNKNADSVLARAQQQDEDAYCEALKNYANEKDEWEKQRNLAMRVLAGEAQSYYEAITAYNPFAELSELGSKLRIKVVDPKLLSCVLNVKGPEVIPSVVKTLTTTGKVTVKQMARSRFHELYQDCICGYMLRVAREVFALLPIDTLLITACTDLIDSRTGQTVEQPVLSAILPRQQVIGLNFNLIDPSDAIESFMHRGDFKASRKSGAFQPIIPLTPADIPQSIQPNRDSSDLLSETKRLRKELASFAATLQSLIESSMEERI